MKLSISNIAWDKNHDTSMYSLLNQLGFSGIEIAPTRLVECFPYEETEYFSSYTSMLKEKYSLEIASIQSIWYSRSEKLFGNKQERDFLFEYTKKAIDLAKATNCHNLVFGCPKNRNIPDGECIENSISFFDAIGIYAYQNDVIISVEAIPESYGTNFINTTADAIDFVKRINNPGLKVNLDIGTVITNGESLNSAIQNIEYINHVHISEPKLECIKPRQLHNEIITLLKNACYDGYISIEMKLQENTEAVIRTAEYLNGLVCTT